MGVVVGVQVLGHLLNFVKHKSPFTFQFSIFTFHNSPFTLLDDEALGGGGVGCAEGDEVGAGGVLGDWKLKVVS